MAHRNHTRGLAEEAVVPIVEETAVVRKERVVTEAVRLHKRVREREEVLDVPLRAEAIEVERVPVGRWVEAPPTVRQEGDTTVYPVLEEVRNRISEHLHHLEGNGRFSWTARQRRFAFAVGERRQSRRRPSPEKHGA